MASLRPQVISNVIVNTSLIAPGGNRIAAMIGTAQWGPIDTVTSISDMSSYISTFGTQKTGDTLTGIQGADLFFNNGGTLKFVRVDDGDAAESAVTLTNGATDVIDFTAIYKGTYGDNILITTAAVGSNRSVTITDGLNIENWTNGGLGYDDNDAIVAGVNANSLLVTAAVNGANGSTNIVDALTNQQMTGGDDGDDGVAITDYTAIMDNQLLQESYNFLLIPGYTTDSGQNTIASKLDTRASSERAFSRYITGVAVNETISTISARTSASKRLTLLTPAVLYDSRVTGNTLTIDASYTACAYAGKLCILDVEVSGTHETVVVQGLQVDSTGKQYYTKAEQDTLLESGTAPIAKIGTKVQMVRGVTRFGDTTSIYYDEYIVDIVDFVTEDIEDYLNTILGKPKKPVDIKTYQVRCDAILQTIVEQGIIEAFQDTVIVEGASPDSLNVTVNIKPTYNSNFIYLTLNIN